MLARMRTTATSVRVAAGLVAGLAACGHSAPPTEGTDAGPSASDGGAPDAGATGSPDHLVIVATPGSALCRRSDDGRALVVTVRNDGDDAIAPTPIEVRTRDGGPSLRHATPTLGAHQSVDLAFDRAPLIGYVPGWSFDVTVDPDGVARTRRGTCDDLRARAAAGEAALDKWYDQASGLYNGNEWWRGANMLEATIDYSRLTGDPTYLASLGNTFDKHSAGGFLNDYYDDEGWWALAWIKAYDLTGDARYLTQAKSIFTDMAGGWDAVCGGGLYWRKERDGKNAIPNELFLTVAARLHLRTPGDGGPGSYLDWAQREWAWFAGTGMIDADDQVLDGLSKACAPASIPYTYNQGVILGGLVDLARATGDDTLLDRAERIADAALVHMVDADGVFIEPACDPSESCSGDGAQFKGIFVRNLAYLMQARPRAAYQAFLLRQSDALWTRARNAADQFASRWSGPFDHADPGNQGSALDALDGAIIAGNPNLALGRAADGSSSCSASEGPARAFDGSARFGSKWCAGGMSGQELRIDLGAVRTIVGFRVRHASGGGEDPAWNTADFDLAVSGDGTTWTPVVQVTGNTAGVTTHPIVGVDARHVRLHIAKAQTATDFVAARIYELEVFGTGP
jgi:predicted alpha-1,6-mannanase (GH76 family)